MNLFELFIKVGVDDQASRQVSSLSSKLGNGLKTAAKIGTMAVSAAGTAIAVMTKQSLDSFAEYEQLIGGIETLFKDSSEKLKKYADDAFESAGLSSNKYMALVTSFSASLIKSLEGDTESAVDLADQTIIDMSDNANKLGTDLSMIQNAYQGFSKQNYTMLDNLKLGYGGTKTEMQRLIREAALLDDSIDANSLSFANIAKAIHVVQNEMGITGATLAEGATTIEGSGRAAAAAWENLKVAIASGDEALMDRRIDEFVSRADIYAQQALPRLKTILWSGAKVIKAIAPELAELLKDPELTKVLTDATVELIVGIGEAVIDNADELVDAAEDVVDRIGETLSERFPQFSFLFTNLEGVVWACLNAFIAFKAIKGVSSSIEAVSKLMSVLTAKTTAQTAAQLALNSSMIAFGEAALATGIVAIAFKDIEIAVNSVKETIEEVEKNNAEGAVQEFKGWDVYIEENKALKEKGITFWDQLWYALDIFDLFEHKKFEDTAIDGSHASGLSYVPFDGYIAELHEGERILTKQQAQGYRGSGITINITVNGAQYDDGDALAEAVALRLQRVLEDEEVAYV